MPVSQQQEKPTEEKKFTVAIDVGHASGTGARGLIDEHTTAASIAAEVHENLATDFFAPVLSTVIDFPDEDNTTDRKKTVAAINSMMPDLVVSIHLDWADSASARGAHACYVSPAGKRAGQKIMRNLGKFLPGRAEFLVRRTGLEILNATRPPAVLLECGFVTSPEDVGIIRAKMQAIAAAIADGIREYFEV